MISIAFAERTHFFLISLASIIECKLTQNPPFEYMIIIIIHPPHILKQNSINQRHGIAVHLDIVKTYSENGQTSPFMALSLGQTIIKICHLIVWPLLFYIRFEGQHLPGVGVFPSVEKHIILF